MQGSQPSNPDSIFKQGSYLEKAYKPSLKIIIPDDKQSPPEQPRPPAGKQKRHGMFEFMQSAGVYSSKVISKIRGVRIKVFDVIYAEDGKKLADEGEIRSDESEPECFKGIFNADLLDSEYLDN